MKVYHKGYSKGETLENNTRNSTHGVGYYVYKNLGACKEHMSSNNKIYAYDLQNGTYLLEGKFDFLHLLKGINFNIEEFKKSPFNSIIDKLAVSSKFRNLSTSQARLACSNYLKSIGIDGIAFYQSGSLAFCIFNKNKLSNEELLKEDYFPY